MIDIIIKLSYKENGKQIEAVDFLKVQSFRKVDDKVFINRVGDDITKLISIDQVENKWRSEGYSLKNITLIIDKTLANHYKCAKLYETSSASNFMSIVDNIFF